MEFFWIFFVLVLILAVYSILTTLWFSMTSTLYKKLPAPAVTQQTRRKKAGSVAFCPKCGNPMDGKPFCGFCGTSAALKYSYKVPIKGSITAQELENRLNLFLAENPYIIDCRLSVQYHNWLLFPFVQLRFRVKSAELQYTLSDHPQRHQFGMAFLYKYRLFGTLGYSTEKLANQWLKNNPDSSLISQKGGHIQHFSTKGNFEAHFYNYVLFKREGGSL